MGKEEEKPRIYHNKLVRDNIPQIIQNNGDNCETRVLADDEFLPLLKKKLVEEAKEVEEAEPDEMLNELADVMQLVQDIAAEHDIPMDQVEEKRAKKEQKAGGFRKKIFLVWSNKEAGGK